MTRSQIADTLRVLWYGIRSPLPPKKSYSHHSMTRVDKLRAWWFMFLTTKTLGTKLCKYAARRLGRIHGKYKLPWLTPVRDLEEMVVKRQEEDLKSKLRQLR